MNVTPDTDTIKFQYSESTLSNYCALLRKKKVNPVIKRIPLSKIDAIHYGARTSTQQDILNQSE